MTMSKTKVLICGMVPDDRIDIAPIDAEVWCINSMPEPLYWDRWFQLHGLGHIYEKHGLHELGRLAIMSKDRPVYLFPEQIARWKSFYTLHGQRRRLQSIQAPEHNFQPFDVEALCAWAKTRYYTGSFAYLVSFATMLGFKEIDFAGIDLWYNPKKPQVAHESWAVPCIEYHIGRAEALGVRIYADSLKTGIGFDVWGGLYGYEAGGNE